MASSFAEGHNCSKRDLLFLLGHFNFAMRIIPQGHSFISHLLALASSVHAFRTDQIIINQACHNEISLWITFLKQWNGLTFFLQRSGLSPRRHSIVYRRSPIRRFRGILPRALVRVSMAPPDARLSPVLSTFRTLPASYRRLFVGKKLDIKQHLGALR